MLAMARALMSHPKLLLLDEPSMGLAPIMVERIFEVIRTVANEGITIFLVEQNVRQALSVATRGYVMDSGRVVLNDTAANLLQDPRVVEAYLGG
jgi:branched-chain amino acid transport system ATP-binding protein